MEDRFPEQAEGDLTYLVLTYLVDQKNVDGVIKQVLNSVIAKYQRTEKCDDQILALSSPVFQPLTWFLITLFIF